MLKPTDFNLRFGAEEKTRRLTRSKILHVFGAGIRQSARLFKGLAKPRRLSAGHCEDSVPASPKATCSSDSRAMPVILRDVGSHDSPQIPVRDDTPYVFAVVVSKRLIESALKPTKNTATRPGKTSSLVI